MGYVILSLVLVSSWINHLYVCFTDESWGFLIAGAIFFPVGVIHGAGNWLGFW